MPPFAANWALFLDVDGTLLEHAARPQAVTVRAEHVRLLDALAHATHGAVALISGRAVSDLDALFAPLRLPAAGLHGAELRLPDGSVRRHAPDAALVKDAAARIERVAAAHAGLVFEDKGLALALHFRQAPELAGLAGETMKQIAGGLGEAYELQAGKLVLEIKPRGSDKGTAIAELMRREPFAGRLPVFVGDDLTDERGFALIERLGGHAIKVGAGETAARWRLPDAAAVRGWLAAYTEFLALQGAATRP